MRKNNNVIIPIGKTTYIHRDDLFAVIAVIVIFMLGAIMVQVGKRMDAEVEAQRQAEMVEIAHDKLVNQEVTK